MIHKQAPPQYQKRKKLITWQLQVKYTPPTEYINDSDYIIQKDGVYYATTRYIHNYTAWDFDTDTANLIIEDRNGDKHSFLRLLR